MSLPVRRSRQADADIDDIWLYVARDSPTAAQRLVEQIYRAEQNLGEHPEIGQARPEVAVGLRHWPVASYVILYRVDSDQVLIVRVVHGARDIGALFRT